MIGVRFHFGRVNLLSRTISVQLDYRQPLYTVVSIIIILRAYPIRFSEWSCCRIGKGLSGVRRSTSQTRCHGLMPSTMLALLYCNYSRKDRGNGTVSGKYTNFFNFVLALSSAFTQCPAFLIALIKKYNMSYHASMKLITICPKVLRDCLIYSKRLYTPKLTSRNLLRRAFVRVDKR